MAKTGDKGCEGGAWRTNLIACTLCIPPILDTRWHRDTRTETHGDGNACVTEDKDGEVSQYKGTATPPQTLAHVSRERHV